MMDMDDFSPKRLSMDEMYRAMRLDKASPVIRDKVLNDTLQIDSINSLAPLHKARPNAEDGYISSMYKPFLSDKLKFMRELNSGGSTETQLPINQHIEDITKKMGTVTNMHTAHTHPRQLEIEGNLPLNMDKALKNPSPADYKLDVQLRQARVKDPALNQFFPPRDSNLVNSVYTSENKLPTQYTYHGNANDLALEANPAMKAQYDKVMTSDDLLTNEALSEPGFAKDFFASRSRLQADASSPSNPSRAILLKKLGGIKVPGMELNNAENWVPPYLPEPGNNYARPILTGVGLKGTVDVVQRSKRIATQKAKQIAEEQAVKLAAEEASTINQPPSMMDNIRNKVSGLTKRQQQLPQ
jgi:hypothetical protein